MSDKRVESGKIPFALKIDLSYIEATGIISRTHINPQSPKLRLDSSAQGIEQNQKPCGVIATCFRSRIHPYPELRSQRRSRQSKHLT